MREVELKILNPIIEDLIDLPTYSTPGSAGLDLRACTDEALILEPNQNFLMPLGIAIHIKDPSLAALVLRLPAVITSPPTAVMPVCGLPSANGYPSSVRCRQEEPTGQPTGLG